MKNNELIEPEIALRVLANSVGYKWSNKLGKDCTGLGHVHDMWDMMSKDMEAIVCLEKYIAENSDDGKGSDFRPVRCFEKYGDGKDGTD